MKRLEQVQLTSNLPSDPRWELTQRVADSPSFRNCPKLRAFLLYVCENALLGRPENIREQLIGSRVFGRSPDYSFSEDNIVRVEARELRKRLAAYFSGEGRDEPAIIEIPKGGYLAVFRSRNAAAPEPEVPQPVTPDQRPQVWVVPALLTLVAVLAAAVVWLAVEKWPQQPLRDSATRVPAIGAADESMYSDLLGTLGRAADRETLLVLSNPKVVLYHASESNEPAMTGTGLTIPAPAELKSSFADALNNIDKNLPYQFLHLTRQEYTGMGEAVTAFHMGRLMQSMRRPIRLTQGRFLDWDHMQKQDLILLGAPQINDWTFHNVGRSNFNLQRNTIENARPLPGEPKQYISQSEQGTKDGTAQTVYGVVKMLSSPYGFRMFLMAGLSSAGTAGVGEFFTAAGKMRPVYDAIRKAATGKSFPADWEVIVRIDVRDDLPVGTTAVAFRPASVSR